jgi:hypothetical protein
MEATLKALKDSIDSVTALEDSVHKEPQPASSHVITAQIMALSKSLAKAHESCQNFDSALMTPVPLEMVAMLDGLKEGPDVYKRKLMEESERSLRSIAERADYLKQLERKVVEKLDGAI